MLLFLISGKAESGKDSFFNIANPYVKNNCPEHKPFRVAFADEVKFVSKQMGWNGEKDENGRSGLIMVGDGARKYFDPDIWIKKAINTIEDIVEPYNWDCAQIPVCFVTDCRYLNEITMLKEWAIKNDIKAYAVRVERPNHENKLTPEQRGNASETALDDYGQWDFIIMNEGTFQEFIDGVETVINDVL